MDKEVVKEVVVDLGNVRVKEFNDMNYEIERLEEVYNPKEKVTETKWRFRGYAGTILGALRLIHSKELLIEEKLISDLNSHLKQVEESNRKLLKALEEVR